MNEIVWAEERATSDLVKGFVNTSYGRDGIDSFATAEGTRTWLRDQGLIEGDDAIDEGARRRVVAVREALRAMLLANNGAPVDVDAIAPLNREASSIPWRCAFSTEGRVNFTPTRTGVEGALGHILAGVAVLILRGVWPNLKVCRAGACHFAFFDRTKNGSRVWCAMRTCGSREKARAYQRRQRSSKATHQLTAGAP